MNRSIRNRLQWWYGLVYVASIVIFGCLVYWRADRDVHERAAQQVVAAAQYLDVSLRNAPARWVVAEGGMPDGPPADRRPWDGPPRDGVPSRDGIPNRDGVPNRDGAPPRNGEGPRFGIGPIPRNFDIRPPRDRGPEGGEQPDLKPDESTTQPIERGPNRRPPLDGRGPDSGGPNARGPEGRGSDSRMFGGRPIPPELPDQTVNDGGRVDDDRPPGTPVEFVIWRSDGSVLASDGEQLTSLIIDNQPTITGDRDAGPVVRFLRGHVQATKRGPHATVITTLRSTENDFANLRAFGLQMAGIGLLLLTTGILGGWWISGQIVKPIERISNTASRISASSLNARIETQDLDHELIQFGTLLNDTFGRLQHSFERLTQFTADASHELRTPLAVIQSQIELTLSQDRTHEVYQQTLHTCLNSAHRLQSMVDGLLLLARADAERLDIAQHTFDLRNVAEDVCVQLQSRAADAGIELDCATPENSVFVTGDPAFLARVPFNLVDNAIQHTPVDGKVKIEVKVDGNEAILTVTDNGAGIAAEHIPHLFERFYRIDVGRSRSRGGSGLGLAICKSLIEVHGGQITCESKLNKGATFTVRLPLAKTVIADSLS